MKNLKQDEAITISPELFTGIEIDIANISKTLCILRGIKEEGMTDLIELQTLKDVNHEGSNSVKMLIGDIISKATQEGN